jgi:hypothetical protein
MASKSATLEAPAGTYDEEITLSDEELDAGGSDGVEHGDYGVGPVPAEESWEGRKRRLPKDWKVKRVPKGHKGNVKKGDRVMFVNTAQPVYLRGENKGQPKQTDPPWRPQMYAVVNRVVDPEKHVIDLRVLFEDEDGNCIIRDIMGVQYDPGTRKDGKTAYRFRSWH